MGVTQNPTEDCPMDIAFPSIVPDLPDTDYHAHPSVSRSYLWRLYSQSPAHARYAEPKSSDAMDFGSAVHLGVLQPDLFVTRVIRLDDNAPKRPTPAQINAAKPSPATQAAIAFWQEMEAAEAEGAIVLRPGAYDDVRRIIDGVHADPFLNRLITGGTAHQTRFAEVSAFATDPETGTRCRVRPDLARTDLGSDGVILDLKTARSAAPGAFRRDVANYGYHLQAAMYPWVWGLARVDPGQPAVLPGMIFLVVEKEPPYAWALYELDAAALEKGRDILRKALALHAQCAAADVWPAYPSSLQTVGLPAWALSSPTGVDAWTKDA
jgi:exodeoxyribonuclease VIII